MVADVLAASLVEDEIMTGLPGGQGGGVSGPEPVQNGIRYWRAEDSAGHQQTA
jgi:hypothetical protein